MGQSKKTKKVSATLGIGYKLKKRKTAFSFIVAFIILLVLNLETVAGLFPKNEPPSFYIEPNQTNYPTFGIEEIYEYIERNCYVPNYDAEIYITLESESFSVDDYLKFRIEIVDKGIISMDKPCYHVYITNPDEECVYGFPGIGQLSSRSTLNRWNTKDHYNDFYVDCFDYEHEGTQYYIPREALVEGYGKYVYASGDKIYWTNEEYEMVFRVKLEDNPSLIGQWRITLFLFDEQYLDRNGEEIDTSNMINYQIQYFDVTNKSPPAKPFSSGEIMSVFYNAVAFVGTYIFIYWGIYDKVEKHKDKLIKLKNKIKENLLFSVSLIVIFLLIVVYLFRPF